MQIVILFIYSKKVQTQITLRCTKFDNWKWTIPADTAGKNNVSLNSLLFCSSFFQIEAELKIYSDNVTH